MIFRFPAITDTTPRQNPITYQVMFWITTASRTSWIMRGKMVKTTSEFMCFLAINIVNEVLWVTQVSISDHK